MIKLFVLTAFLAGCVSTGTPGQKTHGEAIDKVTVKASTDGPKFSCGGLHGCN